MTAIASIKRRPATVRRFSLGGLHERAGVDQRDSSFRAIGFNIRYV